jgi:perosamine synthetase
VGSDEVAKTGAGEGEVGTGTASLLVDRVAATMVPDRRDACTNATPFETRRRRGAMAGHRPGRSKKQPTHRLARPDLGGNERRYVLEALRETGISSLGRHVAQFEAAFSARLGGCHALAVSSGTAAVHLALAALGVGPGDRVIVPDLGYVATANAVRYTGAEPVLVDVDLDSWNLDPAKVATALDRRTRAILVVHLYGNPADLDALRRLAREAKVALVEDAAQALGATWRGRPVGRFGEFACFSFFGNKVVTTGEGGMVVARTAQRAKRVAHLRNQAASPTRRYYHDEVAFNYRLSALQAAVGLAQLERFDSFRERRERIRSWYREELADLPGWIEPRIDPRATAVNWLYTFRLDGWSRGARDRALAELARRGVEGRPVFYPMSALPMHRRPGLTKTAMTTAAKLSAEGLSLPTHQGLSRAAVREIGAAVRHVVGTRRRARRPSVAPQAGLS